MHWSVRDLSRLAYSYANHDLSDAASRLVPTISDDQLASGELLSRALALRSIADDAILLAVVCERERGSSWRQLGDAIGVSRQTVHERYATAVEDMNERMLFPLRQGAADEPDRWVCPGGLEAPDRTVRVLDAWVERDREQREPDSHEVSAGLTHGADTWVADAVARRAQLADRLRSGSLPAGVSERTVRRMLLDADICSRLGRHIADSERGAVITLDGRPLWLLAQSDADPLSHQAGWFLWGVTDDPAVRSSPPRDGGAEIVHADKLIVAVGAARGERVAAPDVTLGVALPAALQRVCSEIADGAPPAAPGGLRPQPGV